MDKYVLFVGMGDWDVPMLNIAQSKGYKTIATNRDKNALSLKEADISILVDGKDAHSILSFIYQNHLEDKIAYVYTPTELSLTVALVAQSLGIRWHSSTSAYVSENKALMKQKFEQHDIPQPTGFTIAGTQIIPELREGKKYIVKPSDNLSSQGITIIEGDKEILGAVSYAMKYSASKTVIVEEYIEGTLHDVNGIITKDGLIRLGINDKKVSQPPYAIVIEGSCPSTLSRSLQDEIYTLLEKACYALGLSEGAVKADVIMDSDENMHILELPPRFHGPLGILHLIPHALGINPFAELLNWLNGETVKEHNVDKEIHKRVFASALETKESLTEKGRILEILEKPGINDSKLWKSNNDVPIYAIWEQDIE